VTRHASHINFLSSTFLLVALLYPNSFLPSELVRSYSLRNIVVLSRSDTLIPPFLHPSVAFLPMHFVPSFSLHVGDLVLLEKNQRAPADLTLLRTSDSSGTCFIWMARLIGSCASLYQRRKSCPSATNTSTLMLRSTVCLSNLRSVCSYSSLFCSECAQQGHPYIYWHVYDYRATHCVLERGAYGPSTDDRAVLCGGRAMGECRACCGVRYRLCGI
jgi:hypothetical protein